MKNQCPACGSFESNAVDTIRVSEIVRGYSCGYVRVDVEALFPSGIHSLEMLRCAACDLKWFVPVVDGDANFYELLQQHDWYYQSQKPEFEYAARLISDFGVGLKILEVGCGQGAFSKYLGVGHRYRGLEFNDKAMDLAKRKGLDVSKKSIQDEAAAAAGFYDVVCHFQVLEHVPDVRGFMSACVKALKPGGLLLTTVPADDSFVGAASRDWLNMPPHHLTRWTDKALVAIYESLGLAGCNIWHEDVALYHQDWYKDTLRQLAISRVIGSQVSLAGSHWQRRLTSLLSRIPRIRVALEQRGASRFEFAGRGHAVTASGVRLSS
jgi:SAM-dependent methyltransferase